MARVLIVGAGGLGCPAALAVAAAGNHTLHLVDSDRVDLSNLPRQVLFGTADVGRAKVDAAANAIGAGFPRAVVETTAGRFDTWNALALVSSADVTLDGSDNFKTKFLVNDACVITGKPFVIAGVHRFEGQVLAVRPRASACYRCLFERPPPRRVTPTCREAGVLGTVAGFAGAIEAAFALALLEGADVAGTLRTFDALTMRFRKVTIARNPGCAVCGEAPTITALDEDEYRPEEDDDADNGSCSNPAS